MIVRERGGRGGRGGGSRGGGRRGGRRPRGTGSVYRGR